MVKDTSSPAVKSLKTNLAFTCVESFVQVIESRFGETIAQVVD